MDTDDGATDAYGDDCSGYTGTPSWCASAIYYDDDDFSSADMCCACGGGSTDGGDDGSSDDGSADDGSADDGGIVLIASCLFTDGSCADGIAYGECIGFGGTWLSECPDSGDDGSPDGGETSVGDACTTAGGVAGSYDCEGGCISESAWDGWLGDSYCDDGSFIDLSGDGIYVYFDCAELEWDLGDCEEGGDADDSSDSDDSSSGIGDTCDYTSTGDGVIDCSGDCVSASLAASWSVDAFCDGVDEAYDYHLDCAAFDYDDGACD
jgi:hypothetical protein